MEEVKKRKAYKTAEGQAAANKRWVENNPEAKEKLRISTYKSRGKVFIKDMSTLEDLEEYEELINIRKKELKERGQ